MATMPAFWTAPSRVLDLVDAVFSRLRGSGMQKTLEILDAAIAATEDRIHATLVDQEAFVGQLNPRVAVNADGFQNEFEASEFEFYEDKLHALRTIVLKLRSARKICVSMLNEDARY